MQISDYANGSLYKYQTVLGALMVYFSLWTIGHVHDNHNERFVSAAERFFEGDENSRKLWGEYLHALKESALTLTRCSLVAAIIGCGLTMFGMTMWYRHHQSLDDIKSKIERRKMQKEIENLD